MATTESQIEQDFIAKLESLKDYLVTADVLATSKRLREIYSFERDGAVAQPVLTNMP